jgi:hypothetical protein
MTRRRNFGGFSWKRLLGISAFKSRVSRTIGIPLTAGGRRRKLGASIFNAVGPVAGTLAVAGISVAAKAAKASGTGPSDAVKKLAHQAQIEARKTGKKEGWQSTFIYFENAERHQHRVVLATNTDVVREAIQSGLVATGFIGLHDAPKGISFGFSLLDESLPPDGVVAQRFLANGHDWVTAWTKYICAQRGDPAPVEHDFTSSSGLLSSMPESSGNANPFGLPFPTNPDSPVPIRNARPETGLIKIAGSAALVLVLIFFVMSALQRQPSTARPTASNVIVNGVSTDNEAEMLISQCGQPSKDTSSDPPHSSPALAPTRIIEYRKSRLRFMFKLLSGAAVWHLVEISEIPHDNSRARTVTSKEAVTRMNCWGAQSR